MLRPVSLISVARASSVASRSTSRSFSNWVAEARATILWLRSMSTISSAPVRANWLASADSMVARLPLAMVCCSP